MQDNRKAEHLTPSGLEPLMPTELYYEFLGMRSIKVFAAENASTNTVFVDREGRPLSDEAVRVMETAPDLLREVVAYLQEPSEARLKTVKDAVRRSFGLHHGSPVRDPRVGI